jgi:hypothetical protein
MVIAVPLFIVSIALFLLALVALADDRRAWARRRAVIEAPPPSIADLGRAQLASVDRLAAVLESSLQELTADLISTAETQPLPVRGAVRAAGSSRSMPRSFAERGTDEVTVLKARAYVPRPAPAYVLRPVPAFARNPSVFTPRPVSIGAPAFAPMPVSAGAPAFAPRPASAGAPPRGARGTPPPSSQPPPELPCWPVIRRSPPPLPPPFPPRKRPGG